MSRRGNDILRAYEQRIREQKSHQTVTQACLWCSDSFVGELCDALAWFATHVAKDHPEHVVTKRKFRRRAQFRAVGSRPLEENIANARAQGASGWVNDGETI